MDMADMALGEARLARLRPRGLNPIDEKLAAQALHQWATEVHRSAERRDQDQRGVRRPRPGETRSCPAARLAVRTAALPLRCVIAGLRGAFELGGSASRTRSVSTATLEGPDDAERTPDLRRQDRTVAGPTVQVVSST